LLVPWRKGWRIGDQISPWNVGKKAGRKIGWRMTTSLGKSKISAASCSVEQEILEKIAKGGGWKAQATRGLSEATKGGLTWARVSWVTALKPTEVHPS
jgi:hypothetical protein